MSFSKTHVFVLAFVQILLIVQNCASEDAGCSQNSIVPQLERLEKLATEILNSSKISETCSKISDEENWFGNQSNFGNFRRLSDVSKRKLKTFRLENTVDLDVSFLMRFLSPCIQLESVELNNVELIGLYPNTSETKLYLPKLNNFKTALSNYPNLNYLIRDLIFAKKDYLEIVNVNRIVDLDINVFIEVAGWRQFVINHEFGEFVMDSQLNGPRDLHSDILQAMNRSSDFILRRLSLKSLSLESSLIPSGLSYLQLKQVYLDGAVRQVPKYMEVIKRNERLKELYILPPEYPGEDHEQPALNLEDIPYTVKKLFLSRVRIDSHRSRLIELEEVLLSNCNFENTTIDQFGQHFRKVKKFGLVPYFLSSGDYQCHTFLDKLLNKYTFTDLKWIFIGDCTRLFGPMKPQGFENVEKELSESGVSQYARDFVLEKSDTGWRGRDLSKAEQKEIVYRMAGIEKFKTLEKYLGF